MKIRGVNGYILVEFKKEEAVLGKINISNNFAITMHDGESFEKGLEVIVPSDSEKIEGIYALVKECDIKGVVFNENSLFDDDASCGNDIES